MEQSGEFRFCIQIPETNTWLKITYLIHLFLTFLPPSFLLVLRLIVEDFEERPSLTRDFGLETPREGVVEVGHARGRNADGVTHEVHRIQ